MVNGINRCGCPKPPVTVNVVNCCGRLRKTTTVNDFQNFKKKDFWKFGFEFETEYFQIQTQIIKQKIHIQRRNTCITYEAEDTH
jgi:hypothetical protein